jgi:hypothetical protein
MLAAPILINRSMTTGNYCAGGSGKGNRTSPRWRPNIKRNGHLSPRSRINIYHLPASRPPLFLIGHYFKKRLVLLFKLSFLSAKRKTRAVPYRHLYQSYCISSSSCSVGFKFGSVIYRYGIRTEYCKIKTMVPALIYKSTKVLEGKGQFFWIDLAEKSEHLTANAKVATVLDSIPASFDTLESEGRQMKQCFIKENI